MTLSACSIEPLLIDVPGGCIFSQALELFISKLAQVCTTRILAMGLMVCSVCHVMSQPWEDSYFVDNTVDTLGGRNMELSDQARSAVAFDAFAILVSIFCIVYATFFKQP